MLLLTSIGLYLLATFVVEAQEYRWSELMPVGSCSVTCGTGTVYHIQRCLTPDSRLTDSRFCSGLPQWKNLPCTKSICGTDLEYRWSELMPVSSCSVTCGTGTVYHIQRCLTPDNQLTDSRFCSGLAQWKNLPCTKSICANWGDWSLKSTCSKSCGGGFSTSERQCYRGSVKVDSKNCTGGPQNASRTQRCNTNPCEYRWSDFLPDGSCSVTCGTGTVPYSQRCLGPDNRLAHNRFCSGLPRRKTEKCHERICSSLPLGRRPIDCAWTQWKYGGCIRYQNNTIVKLERRRKFPEKYGGKKCEDEKLETRIINEECSKQQFVVSSIITALGTVTTRFVPDPNAPTFADSTASRTRICQKRTFVDDTSGIELYGRTCRSSQTKRKKRQTEPLRGLVVSMDQRDILFLVDESGSVEKENFALELELVKTLTEKFCEERSIENTTRVALTTFEQSHTNHIYFNEHNTSASFQEAVDKIDYQEGSTCLVKALKAVRDEVFIETKGSRVRNIKDNVREADGVIILVTDGCFNCDEDTDEELANLQRELEGLGIYIMTYMVNVDDKCKDKFDNLFYGSWCFQGISLPNWKEFEKHIDDIKTDICIGQWKVNQVVDGQEQCG